VLLGQTFGTDRLLKLSVNRIWIMWFLFSFSMGLIGILIGFYLGHREGFDTAVIAGLTSSFKVPAVPDVPNSGFAATQEPAELKEGWYVYITISESVQELLKLKDLLDSNGFRGVIQKITIADESFYKLFVGPEESKELAERLIAELRREPYLPPDIRVVNLRK